MPRKKETEAEKPSDLPVAKGPAKATRAKKSPQSPLSEIPALVPAPMPEPEKAMPARLKAKKPVKAVDTPKPKATKQTKTEKASKAPKTEKPAAKRSRGALGLSAIPAIGDEPAIASAQDDSAASVTISNEDIALRAYFIAERRQAMGWPGDSTSDWVEAERQLRAEASNS